MKLVLSYMAVLLFCMGAQAAEVCELSGRGEFQLTCENTQTGIQVQLAGQEGNEISDIKIISQKRQFQPNPETYVPGVSFELVEEGVFVANIYEDNTGFQVVAIPKTFKTETVNLTLPPNSVEITGTFEALLKGSFDYNDDSAAIEQTVTCKFLTVKCPGKK